MRGGNRVHARSEYERDRLSVALCGSYSQHGLTFGDASTENYAKINCKNCLKLIEEENARLGAGVK